MRIFALYRRHEHANFKIKPQEGSDNLPVFVLQEQISAIVGLKKRSISNNPDDAICISATKMQKCKLSFI